VATPAATSAEWFGAHGYAVLGTEGLLPRGEAIQSVPYFHSVERKPDEDWDSFVARASAETIDHIRAFEQRFAEEGDVYVNLTWVSEAEFQILRQS